MQHFLKIFVETLYVYVVTFKQKFLKSVECKMEHQRLLHNVIMTSQAVI
jgi:hypothetical protein